MCRLGDSFDKVYNMFNKLNLRMYTWLGLAAEDFV